MKQKKATNQNQKVGIIILHFGEWEVTKDCLDSLSKISKKGFNSEIIVVDNSLSKSVQEKTKSHKSKPKLLIPEKNLGFAAGNNFAIKYCQKINCNYILLLNNDTVVTTNFLEKLIDQPDNQHHISGPIIEHIAGNHMHYDYGGYIDWVKGQPKHINLTKYKKLIDPNQHNKFQQKRVLKKLSQQIIKRDFITGCCMLIPIEIIKKIGYLDESYFMYLEDVEYCLRANTHGYSSRVITTSQIFHKGSQSSTEWLKIRYSMINSIKLTLKYIPSKFKATAIAFNLLFYPSLFLLWKLKKIKRTVSP